jgi:hypothetical protein
MVFARRTTGRLVFTRLGASGWAPWTLVKDVMLFSDPTAVVTPSGRLHVFFQDASSNLVVTWNDSCSPSSCSSWSNITNITPGGIATPHAVMTASGQLMVLGVLNNGTTYVPASTQYVNGWTPMTALPVSMTSYSALGASLSP